MGRKPKPEGFIRHCTNGNILQKRNNKWVYIGCDTEGKRVNKEKYYKKKPLVTFPPVNLPDHIKATKYPHYYVSNDGVAYREPRQCDRTGRYGEVNEWGLIQLTTSLRGNPKYGEHLMYEGINIYLYDENNKNIGYKKINIHQLVAQVWVPNPHGYNEILHLDENPRNNHYTNLKWGTHKENMSVKALPEGTIKRIKGGKGSLYEKKDGEWILIPSDKPVWNTLPDGTVSTRMVNGSPEKFIKKDGKWVYQKKERVEEVFETGPDVKYNMKGDKYKRINGKWVYQRKIKQA